MPGIQRQARPDDLDDFASELDRIESESPFGAQRVLDRRLDAIDAALAPADPPQPFAMSALLDGHRPGDPARDSRLAVLGMAGLLLLMGAAGACGAILLLHDRLSRILR